MDKQNNKTETVALGFSIEKEECIAITRLSPRGHYNKGFYDACDKILNLIQCSDEQGEKLRKKLYQDVMKLNPKFQDIGDN